MLCDKMGMYIGSALLYGPWVIIRCEGYRKMLFQLVERLSLPEGKPKRQVPHNVLALICCIKFLEDLMHLVS